MISNTRIKKFINLIKSFKIKVTSESYNYIKYLV